MSKNSFIAELINQKENVQIEFQREFKLEKILQVICAFLNTEGGWIIVGHSGKDVIGISEDVIGKIDELKSNVIDKILPQPLVYVQEDEYKGKVLLLINVLKGSRQPYSFERKYYVRKGSASIEAGPDDISLLLRKSNEYTSTWEKLTTIDASFDELNPDEIEETIREANKLGRGKNLPDKPKSFLSYFQIFDLNAVKNGSVVLYGIDPVKFLPQCRVRITVMPHGKTGSRYDDSLLIEDNLFIAFGKVHKYFEKELPIVSEFKYNEWVRTNREKYPMEALDEAVVNAMVHRDYGDVSGDVTINIYPGKIEITNSGEIPPDIIKGKNRIEAHHSVLRNPTIVHMFYLRGKMEKLGRGLSLIKNRFTEYGLKAPEWTTQSGYTTLTLFGVSKPIDVNDRMINFLKKLKTEEQFTREVYEKFFLGSISEKTARLDIAKLTDGGWVSKIGDGPSTKYLRTNKELP